MLATDIDPAWFDPHGGYEVLRRDVVADPPPQPGTFANTSGAADGTPALSETTLTGHDV